MPHPLRSSEAAHSPLAVSPLVGEMAAARGGLCRTHQNPGRRSASGLCRILMILLSRRSAGASATPRNSINSMASQTPRFSPCHSTNLDLNARSVLRKPSRNARLLAVDRDCLCWPGQRFGCGLPPLALRVTVSRQAPAILLAGHPDPVEEPVSLPVGQDTCEGLRLTPTPGTVPTSPQRPAVYP